MQNASRPLASHFPLRDKLERREGTMALARSRRRRTEPWRINPAPELFANWYGSTGPASAKVLLRSLGISSQLLFPPVKRSSRILWPIQQAVATFGNWIWHGAQLLG